MVRHARAREIVRSIIEDLGFVSEKSFETMEPEVRQEVEKALLAKDKRIGSSVLTYAN